MPYRISDVVEAAVLYTQSVVVCSAPQLHQHGEGGAEGLAVAVLRGAIRDEAVELAASHHHVHCREHLVAEKHLTARHKPQRDAPVFSSADARVAVELALLHHYVPAAAPELHSVAVGCSEWHTAASEGDVSAALEEEVLTSLRGRVEDQPL